VRLHRFNIFRSWGANRARGAAGAQFEQAPAQDGGGLGVGSVEDGANVAEFEPGIPVRADLAQAAEIFFGVGAIVSGRAAGARQQADGFVVQHGAAGEMAGTRELGNGQRHGSATSVNPEAVDRSREKCAFFERHLACPHAALRVPTHHRESCLAAPESGQQQDADSEEAIRGRLRSGRRSLSFLKSAPQEGLGEVG